LKCKFGKKKKKIAKILEKFTKILKSQDWKKEKP
jgi:hypothetical protein